MSKKTNISDPFWSEQISILFKEDRIAEFFPSDDMSLEERLNSMARLGIYFSLIISLYRKDIRFMLLTILTLGLTFIVYNYAPKEELFTSNTENCTAPTVNNPFMNVLPSDYQDNPNRPAACNQNDPEVKKKIKEYFENGLYRDVNDPFERNNSQRQFYTMPSTTIPNDQIGFARWLFGKENTCKDDMDCNPYQDLRYNKPDLIYRDRTAEDVSTRYQYLNTRKHPTIQTYDQ